MRFGGPRRLKWILAASAAGIGAAVAWLSVAGPRPAPSDPAGEAAETVPGLCRRMTFAGAGYVACRIDLDTHDVALRLDDGAGRPYGGARRLADALGGDFVLAMNGGMYHEDRSPVGLYVEDGVERGPATTAKGDGNFFLKPNGVFWIAGTRAGVEETAAFQASGRPVDQATQSGPMLVAGGALHPRFIEGSASLNTRNGVCVVDGGRTVVLAISVGPVNFIDFARLFRDGLGCRDALYLDGSVSTLVAPADGIEIVGERRLGPLIAVTKTR